MSETPPAFVDWLLNQCGRGDGVGFLAKYWRLKNPKWSTAQEAFSEEVALAEQEFAACRSSEEKGADRGG